MQNIPNNEEKTNQEDIQTTTVPVKKKRNGGFSNLLSSIALIIGILALASLFYFGNQILQWRQNSNQTFGQIQNNLLQNQTNLDQLDAQVKQTQDTLQKQQSTVTEIQNNLKSSTQHDANKILQLNQAIYLVQLANLNLQFDHNIENARKLLEAANDALAQLNDASFIPVRKQIMTDVAALQVLTKIDKVTLLSKLDALFKQIPTLPLLNKKGTLENKESAPSSMTESNKNYWQKFLDQSLAYIQKFIVIRHQNKTYEPLLDPTQQQNLINHIQQQFSQAQWAVLHNDDAIYQYSLNNADVWLIEYFSGDSQAIQNVLANIKQLKQEKLNPPLPDLAKTLQLLQEKAATFNADVVNLNQNKPAQETTP